MEHTEIYYYWKRAEPQGRAFSLPISCLLMYKKQESGIHTAQMRSFIALDVPVVSEECKHLQKLSHTSGGLIHPVANLTAYHPQERGVGLQVPNLIVCPNSAALNVSSEVQNVSALSHSLKSGQALLVNLAPQLLGRSTPISPKAQLRYWGVPNPSALLGGNKNW